MKEWTIFTINIPVDLMRRIEAEQERRNFRSKAQLIKLAVEEFLNKEEGKR